MGDEGWVQKIIAGIVIGNLIILSIFFLGPRMQFLLAHKGFTSNQLMETPGSSDMPNQRTETYVVANRIRELTPLEATIFMPPGNRPEGSFRSAATQILYPRIIFFGDNENFERVLKEAKKAEASYFVFSPDWQPEFCAESSRIELTKSGFGMCRLVP